MSDLPDARNGEASDFFLSMGELRAACDFLYRRTGMAYGETKRYFIERRIADRMAAARSPSVQSYLAQLRSDDSESELFINSFTINETYFYREEHQLRCLGRSLMPELIASRKAGDLVRIWSIPCATGEEPYSIAIWLLENWPLVDAYHIEIIGSDIDTQVLAAASTGNYGERALSQLPANVVEQYFENPRDGNRRILQDIRESVKFTQVNLMNSRDMAAQGRFDVVFCRNVLIYFDEISRQDASQNLYDALNPGGFICLGHAESMMRITNQFAVRRFEDAIVYQRPER
ncbi:MAG: protein-glutamate O-methyltransferase CheR [Beijerinckiaceae bacterium]|nr:protein-glutamate O-methyltransferase CheR [Beijerinckiaceae bacterium]